MAGGFVQVNRIDHVDNVGAYVVKYMLKDTEDPRLMGENAYLHSRGLNEPYEVTSWSSESSEFWSVARALQRIALVLCQVREQVCWRSMLLSVQLQSA